MTRGKSLNLSGPHLPTLSLPGRSRDLHEAARGKLPCKLSSPGPRHCCVLEQRRRHRAKTCREQSPALLLAKCDRGSTPCRDLGRTHQLLLRPQAADLTLLPGTSHPGWGATRWPTCSLWRGCWAEGYSRPAWARPPLPSALSLLPPLLLLKVSASTF